MQIFHLKLVINYYMHSALLMACSLGWIGSKLKHTHTISYTHVCLSHTHHRALGPLIITPGFSLGAVNWLSEQLAACLY